MSGVFGMACAQALSEARQGAHRGDMIEIRLPPRSFLDNTERFIRYVVEGIKPIAVDAIEVRWIRWAGDAYQIKARRFPQKKPK